MAKLWAGRTSGETSAAADDFNSSIRFDSRMYRQDITGSMAHAAMLGAQGPPGPGWAWGRSPSRKTSPAPPSCPAR